VKYVNEVDGLLALLRVGERGHSHVVGARGDSRNDLVEVGLPVVGGQAEYLRCRVRQVDVEVRPLESLIIVVNQPYSPNEYLDLQWQVGRLRRRPDATRQQVLGADHPTYGSPTSTIIPLSPRAPTTWECSSFTRHEGSASRPSTFVTYFRWLPLGLAYWKDVDPDNACGLKVAVQTTTTEDNRRCSDPEQGGNRRGQAGNPEAAVRQPDDATNAVILGKVDAMSADSPVTAYAVKQSGGKLQLAAKSLPSAPLRLAAANKTGARRSTGACSKPSSPLMDNGHLRPDLPRSGALTPARSRSRPSNDAQS